MKRVIALCGAALGFALMQPTWAQEAPRPAEAAAQAPGATPGPKQGPVEAAMAKLLGEHADTKVDSIGESPVPGFSEVVVGTTILYVSNDGRYLFQGNLIDVDGRRNLTDERMAQLEETAAPKRLAAINALPEASMIIFGPDQPKHTITVFTDLDCGYCRKLHSEIKQYNALGIRVRYLAFPRAGIPSDSYDKTVSVWCAQDRNAALTAAKAGAQVAKKTCDSPVGRQYDLGKQLGVTGTPTIITDTGRTIPGYVPPERLAKELGGGA